MLQIWTFVVVAVIMLAYLLPALRRFKRKYDFAQTLPGPTVWEFIRKKGHIIDFIGECREKYGPVFRFWLGPNLNVVFTDPEDVKTIASSNVLIDKSASYTMVEDWLGKGLLTNGGENWHLKRKLLTPGFHFKILSTFKEPMEECCDILVNRLHEVADGRPINIYKYITLMAMDVICETAMGIKVNAQLNDQSEFVKKTQQICLLIHRQIFTPWKRIDFLYKWTAEKKAREEKLKFLHAETKRVIKERRMILESQTEEKNNPSNVDDLGSKQRRPFLDSLLNAQRDTGLLSDVNIQEEVDTFMFEGHDTTSSAIAFTIFLLAKHPDVQQKVFDEICNNNDDDSLKSLPYLEAVIKESLRLYPSVPSFSRETKQPFTIGQHTIPAGVTVVVNLYYLHREPAHFPNPEEFRPERFTKDADPLHPYAQVAFSAGPRNCIGQKFAMLELKCSLSRLVKEFEFSAVAGFQMDLFPALILKSMNGVWVRLNKRKT